MELDASHAPTVPFMEQYFCFYSFQHEDVPQQVPEWTEIAAALGCENVELKTIGFTVQYTFRKPLLPRALSPIPEETSNEEQQEEAFALQLITTPALHNTLTRSLKTSSAPGQDEIPNTILIHLLPEAISYLTALLRKPQHYTYPDLENHSTTPTQTYKTTALHLPRLTKPQHYTYPDLENHSTTPTQTYKTTALHLPRLTKPQHYTYPDLQNHSTTPTQTYKTTALHLLRFTKDHPPPPPPKLGNEQINWTDKTKYLGVILDRKLFFNQHLRETAGHVRGAIRGLSPIISPRSRITLQTRITVFKAFIMPLLTYTNPVCVTTAADAHTQIDILSTTNMTNLINHIQKIDPKFKDSIQDHPNPLIRNLLTFIPRMKPHFMETAHLRENYHATLQEDVT
ncbi:hypothetical protein PR048_010885 [Dryococelus australis]|uniref:Uncharacterized protein n=1 Tax=Dryococelus australis TaxID=614101 RepID=A0ABQ9I557_9NEOP|nr:hypothetical protein PR048_010885 [Dryococelus australis]